MIQDHHFISWTVNNWSLQWYLCALDTMAVIASYQCNSHAKYCDAVTTSNHNTSERGEGWIMNMKHEHEDVVFLGARKTTQYRFMSHVINPAAKMQTMVLSMRMWSSWKDLEVLQQSMLRVLLTVITKSLSFRISRSRKRLHKWKKTSQSTNGWRSLKSLNPQGIHKECTWMIGWTFIFCFVKGFDVVENTQMNDIRVFGKQG